MFACSILVHPAYWGFLTITALYKSTYLLPVTFEFLINVMYRTMISWLYRRYINCPLIALAACSGKRSLTVWRPFFCLSVPSAYSPGVACNAASVHFGPTVRRADVRVILPFHFFFCLYVECLWNSSIVSCQDLINAAIFENTHSL